MGGEVRDQLLARLGRGAPSKDLDVEVFGLSLDTLAEILTGMIRGENPGSFRGRVLELCTVYPLP